MRLSLTCKELRFLITELHLFTGMMPMDDLFFNPHVLRRRSGAYNHHETRTHTWGRLRALKHLKVAVGVLHSFHGFVEGNLAMFYEAAQLME